MKRTRNEDDEDFEDEEGKQSYLKLRRREKADDDIMDLTQPLPHSLSASVSTCRCGLCDHQLIDL